MATTTRVLSASVNGTVYTTNANGALEAIDTCHSGTTAPTNEVANGKFWLDTTTTPGILKQYNNANWEVVVNSTNVQAAGALMDSEVDADIKTLVLPASTTISTYGRTLVDDTSSSAARTTLGLGSLSTSNTTLGNLATSNTSLGNLATSNASLGTLGTANTANLANQVGGTLDRDSFEGYNSGTGITVNNSTGAVTSNVTSPVGLPPANNTWSTSATATTGGSFSGSTNGRYGSAMLDIGSNNNNSVSFAITINGDGSYFWGIAGELVTANTMISSGETVNFNGDGRPRKLAGSFYVAPGANLVLTRNEGNVSAVLRTRYQEL